MKILVAGGTGAIGVPLVKKLLANGDSVTSLARSRVGAELLHGLGADVIHTDVLDRDALLAAVDGQQHDAVIHELTALKKLPIRFDDMAATNALRTEGTRNLLEVAHRVGAKRYVTQSVAFGYGYTDHGSTVLTEDAPFGEPDDSRLSSVMESMRSAENQALEDDRFETVVLRYGLSYGADLTANARRLRRRTLPVPMTGGRLAMIHHDDAAGATVAALNKGGADEVYNIVDETPVTWRHYLETLAAIVGTPRPMVLPGWFLRALAPYAGMVMTQVNMRVSNAKAVRELEWRPKYRSYRDGVAASAHRLGMRTDKPW